MIFENILTIEQSDTIANAMSSLYEADRSSLNYENDARFYNGSYGFNNLAEAEQHIPLIEKTILKHYPNYKFSNVYSRIYLNESILNIHTDRCGLDLTLTVCVYSDVNYSWPIYVSTIPHEGEWSAEIPDSYYKSEFNTYHTPVGTGVTCLGRTYAHWRDSLVCKPDQKVIQVFYHWTKI